MSRQAFRLSERMIAFINRDGVCMELIAGTARALLFTAAIFLAGCWSAEPDGAVSFQAGESVIMIGERPSRLAFIPVMSIPANVRNTYRDGLPQTVHYEPDRDYVLDASGGIRRTQGSRIPDFRANVLHGRASFDHSEFPGIGNDRFFIYVDYWHHDKWSQDPALTLHGAPGIPASRAKLEAGGKVRMVVYGDSISAGAGASMPSLIFWERWADELRRKYPGAVIETFNGATGGDTTIEGLKRLSEKVLSLKPDLVLIGFGMNDHNRGGVPPAAFSRNLRKMIGRIRAESGAEIVLLSTFPPNPKWRHGTGSMAAYAAATRSVALEMHCAYADVYSLWQRFAENKKPEDFLSNNINHPNDFGHWIYFQALVAMGMPLR